MSDASVVQARLVGALFVERGLLTEEQLERALELQAERGELLGEILVTEFEISRIELASVLAEQWAELEQQEEQKAEAGAGPEQGNGTVATRRRIGEIFVERGFVSESELEQALETQKESGQPLGEVLIERGSLSRLDLAGALAEQWAGLEKLRPPSPKRVEAWQQVAPAETAAAAAQGAMRSEASEEPRGEETPGVAAVDPGLADAVAVLSARLDVVEAGLGDGREAAGNEISELRSVLDELRDRLAVPEARLGEVEGRIEALEDAKQVANEVRGRVEALEQGAVTGASREALEKVAGALAARLDLFHAQLDEAVSGTRAGLDAMLETLTEVQERVDGVGAAAQMTPEEREELAGLEERVRELAAAASVSGALAERLAALEARAGEAPWRDEVVALQARLEDLSASEPQLGELTGRLAALEEAAHERPWRKELRSLDEEIDVRLAGVAGRLDEAGVQARAELEQLRASLEDVASRLDETSAGGRDELAGLRHGLTELTARIDALGGDWAAAAHGREELAGLEERVRELAAAASVSGALAERLAALEARAGEAPWRDEVVALQARLEDLSASEPQLGELTGRLVALEEAAHERPWRKELRSLDEEIDVRLAGVAGRLDEAGVQARAELEQLRASLEDVASRLDETSAGGRDELAGLRHGLTELTARIDTLGGDWAAAAHGREELAGLEERVRELAAAASVSGALAERLAALEARAGEAPWRDEVVALQARLEDLSASEPQLGELTGRLVALEEAAHERPWRKELRSLDEEIDVRLAGVAGRLDEAGVQARAELEQLRASLEDVASRLDETSAGGRDELAGLRHGLTELTARIDTLGGDWAAAAHGREELARLDTQVQGLAAAFGEAKALADRLAELEPVSLTAPTRAELSGRLAALESHATKTPWVDEISALRTRLEGLSAAEPLTDAVLERLATLEASVSERPWRKDLNRQAEELAGRLDGLAGRLEESGAEHRAGFDQVQSILDELADRVERAEGTWAAADHTHDELTHVQARVEEFAATVAAVDGLAARLAAVEVAATATPWRGELSEAAARLDHLAAEFARAASEEAIALLRGEIGAVREVGAQAEHTLASRLVELGERLDEMARATAELQAAGETGASAVGRSELDRVEKLVEEIGSVAREAARTAGIAEDHARERVEADAAARETLETELRQRIDNVKKKTRDDVAAVGARVDGLAADLEASQREALGRDELEQTVQEHEILLTKGISAHDEAIAVLRRRLEEIATSGGVLSERLAATETGLAARLDEHAEALAAESAVLQEGYEAIVARLSDVEHHARSMPDTLLGLRTELTDIASRLGAVEASEAEATRVGSGWTDAAAALGSRLIAVEEALVAPNDDVVEPRLSELERRLEAEVSRADERTRATEDALREGLSALGARLAESESAYRDAGDALRRSIEGLGQVIVDADSRIAGRDEPGFSGSLSADAYVAFAPTPDGYRLLAIDGGAPEVGDTVELDGHDHPLVVTRLGVSPIPLDDRPCVYLERTRSGIAD